MTYVPKRAIWLAMRRTIGLANAQATLFAVENPRDKTEVCNAVKA
jgi:hypothetical protein